MDGISSAGGQGALGVQASMAAGVMGNAQTPPPAPAADNAARSAGMQAEGKGQKLDVVA